MTDLVQRLRDGTRYHGNDPELLNEAAAEIERLTRELAEAREDAARYRALRAMNWHDSPMCVVMDPKRAVKLGHDCPSLERLDAAIDSARGTEGA